MPVLAASTESGWAHPKMGVRISAEIHPPGLSLKALQSRGPVNAFLPLRTVLCAKSPNIECTSRLIRRRSPYKAGLPTKSHRQQRPAGICPNWAAASGAYRLARLDETLRVESPRYPPGDHSVG